MYEFLYSKSQSGRYHDRPATEEEKAQQDPCDPFYGRKILGGNDNYFNNGEYQSGWTYYGRTIGTPFITPLPPDADGITLGVFNNRIIAHYIGIKGYFFQIPPVILAELWNIQQTSGTYPETMLFRTGSRHFKKSRNTFLHGPGYLRRLRKTISQEFRTYYQLKPERSH